MIDLIKFEEALQFFILKIFENFAKMLELIS